MHIHYNVFAVLLAATFVYVLSVLGSFICWMNTAAWDSAEENKSQSQRWKWMVIAWFVIVTAMLLGKPEGL